MISHLLTHTSLQFKSSAGGHAALCLPNKTFQLRQVQTSNDVHIMTSKTTSEDRGSEPPRSSIISIAQCGSSLELAGSSKESAIVHLKQLLPLFEDEDSASDGTAAIRSKSVALADVPLSDGECEVAWTQLCAFETQDGRFAYRPSPRLLVKAWSGILSTAILDRIDLADPVTRSRLDVLCESIEDVPHPLPQSILKRLKAYGSNDEATTLDQIKTVEFTGQVLLEDLGEVSTQDFVRQWQNLLPEKWRGQAVLDKLSVHTSADHVDYAEHALISRRESMNQQVVTRSEPLMPCPRKPPPILLQLPPLLVSASGMRNSGKRAELNL